MTAAILPAPRRHARATILTLGVWMILAAMSGLPVAFGAASCPFAERFHKPCLGCGMTRALDLLAHGDIRASLMMHPLVVPTIFAHVAFVLATLHAAWRTGSPLDLWGSRFGRLATLSLVSVITLDFVLWLARFAGFMSGPVPV